MQKEGGGSDQGVIRRPLKLVSLYDSLNKHIIIKAISTEIHKNTSRVIRWEVLFYESGYRGEENIRKQTN
jgi:hypothetical protein